MEEKNVHCKTTYKCGICGNAYDSVQKRMNSEMACVKKQMEEKKKAEAEKKMAEKKTRKEAVDKAVDIAVKLMADYIRDYGPYEYDKDSMNDYMLPSKFWRYFWN